VLFAEDSRPLAERLTREAKRLLIAAAAIVVVVGALFVTAIAVAIAYLT
jgi:hypothetical protein